MSEAKFYSYNGTRKEIEYELKTLQSSLDMYTSTKSNLETSNVSNSQISFIENEIDKLKLQIDNAKERLSKVEQTEAYTDNIYEVDYLTKYMLMAHEKYDNVMSNDFIVRFPLESGFKAFMFKRVEEYDVENSKKLFITIREYHNNDFNIEYALNELVKDSFKIIIDRVNKNGNIYYSTVYSNCECTAIHRPMLDYANSDSNYMITVTFEKKTVFDNDAKRHISEYLHYENIVTEDETSSEEETNYTTYSEEEKNK